MLQGPESGCSHSSSHGPAAHNQAQFRPEVVGIALRGGLLLAIWLLGGWVARAFSAMIPKHVGTLWVKLYCPEGVKVLTLNTYCYVLV
jgi:putative effector of murein hydrolase LrgA (UPF0299 family)